MAWCLSWGQNLVLRYSKIQRSYTVCGWYTMKLLGKWLKCQLRRSSGVVVAGPKHFVCQMDCLRVHVTVAVDRMLPHLWIITNRWHIWQAPKKVFLQYMNLIQVSIFRLHLLEYFGDGYSIFQKGGLYCVRLCSIFRICWFEMFDYSRVPKCLHFVAIIITLDVYGLGI